MNKLARFINDVYQGLYYYALKYESAHEAKSNLRLRLAVTLFLYYFSLLLLLITLLIKLYGTKKFSFLEGAMIIFGIYFILYRYLIKATIVVSSFEDSADEMKRKVKLSLLVFWGSIVLLAVTAGLIGYLMPKK
ncbi:hypothetical protein [Spirosoma agri]|uniref:Uncharacterized protein n=1 Tax=Spirosoma agri TaxID=1987381 RepID=A0A6M0IRH3_9BACT|nr:hypothetical protein [Spirosoma agri]NEU70880.1 hypothetical protein [Spirosoma agri]